MSSAAIISTMIERGMKMVPTTNQASNILAKNWCFIKYKRSNVTSHRINDTYSVIVWAHINDKTLDAEDEEE
jgi:hypothetical protein